MTEPSIVDKVRELYAEHDRRMSMMFPPSPVPPPCGSNEWVFWMAMWTLWMSIIVGLSQ